MLFRRRSNRRTVPAQRRLSVQVLEKRQMMAGDAATGLDRPLGATNLDTGEFMLGRIVVTPVFLESNGTIDNESQDWGATEIRSVLNNISAGLEWWNTTLENLNTVHSLDFVIDETYAVTPVPTAYEPIDRSSDDYTLYVREFLRSVELGSFGSTDDGMFAFNDSQRAAHDADWSFTIFVVDSSDDANGFFPATGSFQGAFALAGGLYMVLPSTRPIRTIAHETAHLFWALDEYQGGDSYTDHRGVYDTQNQNAWNNPTPGFVQADSIMASDAPMFNAFNNHTSSPVTLAQVGWRDSDFDGIFDVLDVPMQLSGSGTFNPLTGQIQFSGRANAVPYRNQNPEGPQSDITTNRIRSIQVSFDDGPWQTITQPNRAVVDLELLIDAPTSFNTFALRAIDTATGVQSNVVQGSSSIPAAPANALTAFSFFDADGNGDRGIDEHLMSAIQVSLVHSDGTPLRRGSFSVSDLPVQTEIELTQGMTFSGTGDDYAGPVEVRTDINTNRPLIQVRHQTFDFWTARLSNFAKLEVSFDQPTSHVEVDVVGLEAVAFARVEALDVNGNLIDRITTDLRNDANGQLSLGELQTLSINDPEGRISRIRVAGHAQSWIGVSSVRHGVAATLATNQAGVIDFGGVPDGQYQLIATPLEVIHAFAPQTITVSDGQIVGGLAHLAATRIDSLRHRVSNPEDVNGDSNITALDALQVINDLNFFGNRFLTFAESGGSMVDVDNDGRVTAVDALRVINRINQEDNNGPSGEPISNTTASADDSESISLALTGTLITSTDQVPAHDAAIGDLYGGAGQTETLGIETKWVDATVNDQPRLNRLGSVIA